jgi:hypothetical protein
MVDEFEERNFWGGKIIWRFMFLLLPTILMETVL